jgi:hypothetical protein
MSKNSRRRVLCTPVVALCVAAGCGAPSGVPAEPPGDMSAAVHAVLRDADGPTLYALHPFPHETQGPTFADADRFHDYVVLGQAEVDAAVAQAVVAEVHRGIADSDGTVAACFNPRHGIRVAGEGGTVDLVICFECLSLTVHHDGVFEQSLTTTSAPDAALEPFWRAAGLTLHR